MKKMLLPLLLTLFLLLSLCPPALAAEEDCVRETSFFTPQTHTELDYSDIAYEHIDIQPVLAEIDAIRSLMEQESSAGAVREQFFSMMDHYEELLTMFYVLYIQRSQNVLDEAVAEEVEYANGACNDLLDAINLLIRDALHSPCAGVFREMMSEEEAAAYLNYEGLTEEERTMSQREVALENEYNQTAALLTVEYNGEEWTDNSAYSACLAGEISSEDYAAISDAYLRKQNEVLGEIYLRMVSLRTEIAKSCGYDDYCAYAYAELYQRDYTPEDIRSFHQAVKDNHFSGLSDELVALYLNEANQELASATCPGEEIMDQIEPYIGRMSSEMAEAYNYMRTHHFYDVADSECKEAGAYTITLPSYGVPFYFDNINFYLGKFKTNIHEFGHYNQAYWNDCGWDQPIQGPDLSEVHSQGLELMFSHWYDEIFEEDAQMVLDYLLANLTYSLADGSIYDELQQYVYTTDGVTLTQINQKYRQLAEEYGMVSPDDPREALYDWVQVHHTFLQPCYYISYAVSAAGAFTFWLDAQTGDYFNALDEYLKFTALPSDLTFQESFQALDMENPLTPEYLSELAETLRSVLALEERAAAQMPSDLTGSEWFAAAARELYTAGIVETDKSGRIHPYSSATRSDAAALIELLLEEPPAVEDEEAAITRLEFVLLLAETFDLGEADASPFSDTDNRTVAFLAENGLLNGYHDGTFRPDQPITRAEMWVIFYRVLLYAVNPLLTDAAA